MARRSGRSWRDAGRTTPRTLPALQQNANRRITTAILAGFMCFTQLGIMLSLLLGRGGIAGVAPAALALAVIVGDHLAARRTKSDTLLGHTNHHCPG